MSEIELNARLAGIEAGQAAIQREVQRVLEELRERREFDATFSERRFPAVATAGGRPAARSGGSKNKVKRT